MYSTRTELNSIQSRWRETHYDERNQSRGGDLPARALPYEAREALVRYPACLHMLDELPLQEAVIMLNRLAGTAELAEDADEYSL